MRGNDRDSKNVSGNGASGFTVLELIVVVAIFTVLAALALPLYNQWRQNIQYRQAAYEIFSSMRSARANAIESNRQYRIELVAAAANSQYRMWRGDRSYNTAAGNWTALGTGMSTLNQSVTVNSTANGAALNGIVFNPNGSAGNTVNIFIRDYAGINRFLVSVDEQTGRIRVDNNVL